MSDSTECARHEKRLDDIDSKLSQHSEDLAYIRGKIDTVVDSNKNDDWWGRAIAGLALLIAWIK